MMKKAKKMKIVFGIDEYGFVDIPSKISRIVNSENRGGCPFYLPHEIETSNCTMRKNRKNWKNNREFQWEKKK